jgi:hypothetical protein
VSRASFHFEGELPELLPAGRRDAPVEYEFSGRPSLKHAIESLGIPHVEADVLEMDGKPAGLDGPLHDGAVVRAGTAVRRLEHGQAWRFVLDCHLGRLAKYLRMLGLDTLYGNHAEDSWLARVSATEERWLLTMDRGLLMRARVRLGWLVRGARPRQQLERFLRRHDVAGAVDPISRCLECNAPLAPVEKERVWERIPPKTRLWCEEFRHCPGCGKLYWKGSHFDRMAGFVGSSIGHGGSP